MIEGENQEELFDNSFSTCKKLNESQLSSIRTQQ